MHAVPTDPQLERCGGGFGRMHPVGCPSSVAAMTTTGHRVLAVRATPEHWFPLVAARTPPAGLNMVASARLSDRASPPG
jgi:hypothetical protein